MVSTFSNVEKWKIKLMFFSKTISSNTSTPADTFKRAVVKIFKPLVTVNDLKDWIKLTQHPHIDSLVSPALSHAAYQ
jgi:hypothetical protein